MTRDGIQHTLEKLEENKKELENQRVERTTADDRNREGIDLHMKMASITEDMRKSGATSCVDNPGPAPAHEEEGKAEPDRPKDRPEGIQSYGEWQHDLDLY